MDEEELDSNKSKIHSESKSQREDAIELFFDSWIAINQRYILKANHNFFSISLVVCLVG